MSSCPTTSSRGGVFRGSTTTEVLFLPAKALRPSTISVGSKVPLHSVLSLCPLLSDRAPANVHEWVRNEFGQRLFRIFFKTYTEKVWGMSCDEISADWAAQRIKGLDLGVAVFNAFWRYINLPPRSNGGGVKSLIESFEYPRRGPGMMWESAAGRVTMPGGRSSWAEPWTRSITIVSVGCGTSSCGFPAASAGICRAPCRELGCGGGPLRQDRAQAASG